MSGVAIRARVAIICSTPGQALLSSGKDDVDHVIADTGGFLKSRGEI